MRLIATTCLILILSSPLLADPPTSQPAAPSPDLAALQAENAALKAQIETLKQQLAETSAKSPTTNPADDHAKSFRTMQDILANTPTDLRPKADPDWYRFTASKYYKWVEEQMVGLQFDAKLALNEWEVMSHPNPRPGAEWIVFIYRLPHQHFTYFGSDNAWSLASPTPFSVDPPTARKWEKVKKGALLPVKGVIHSVSVTRETFTNDRLPQLHYTIELRDLTITLPK